VSEEGGELVGSDEFTHGYTYSGHPVACAVALENLRIMEEENIVDHARDVAAPHLKAKWEALSDHPLVGEAKISGLMASVALTPDKAARAAFAGGPGTAGLVCRGHCFGNNLVMRHVGDRMIICPPLTITPEEIDTLVDRATRAFDLTHQQLKDEGLMQAAS